MSSALMPKTFLVMYDKVLCMINCYAYIKNLEKRRNLQILSKLTTLI